jgi:hypothetical protein
MGTAPVGKVITHATIENLMEADEAERGQRSLDDVRRVQVEDALVDTGATMLSLSTSLIQQRGLRNVRTRSARTAGGMRQFDVYEAVQLTVQGRQCDCEVPEHGGVQMIELYSVFE